MAEYIERDALRDAVESIDWYSVYKGKLTAGAPSSANALYKANDIYSAIYNAPAADVVTVVRCNDCKCWHEDDDIGYCDNPDGLDNYANPDDYCSYGERKDNG